MQSKIFDSSGVTLTDHKLEDNCGSLRLNVEGLEILYNSTSKDKIERLLTEYCEKTIEQLGHIRDSVEDIVDEYFPKSDGAEQNHLNK